MSFVKKLNQAGFVLLPNAVPNDLVNQLLTNFREASANNREGIKSRRGETYASRNVLETVPLSRTVWQLPLILGFLRAALSPEFGLVRGLFFDKPPDRTWSLGWHKDMTIAVKDNSLPSQHFSKPTRKSGVPHVEAPAELLQRMVTLRIHLDRVTRENGPLEVMPASHHSGKQVSEVSQSPVTILAEPGDVLAMKPLISHASGSSYPGTKMHRRILHLEFADSEALPDGYRWFQYLKQCSR